MIKDKGKNLHGNESAIDNFAFCQENFNFKSLLYLCPTLLLRSKSTEYRSLSLFATYAYLSRDIPLLRCPASNLSLLPSPHINVRLQKIKQRFGYLPHRRLLLHTEMERLQLQNHPLQNCIPETNFESKR